MKDDLAEVIERARNDRVSVDEQHAAFTELVRRYEEAAFGWSFKLLDDPTEAQDATQDAFLTAWLKLRQLRDPLAFGAWLKRLVVTQCNRRRRRRRNSEFLNANDLCAVTNVEHERRERQRLLAAAMSKLSETEYRVVVLFYFLGRKIEEIAATLEMPRGTVGKRLYAARLVIRRNLPSAIRKEFQRLQPAREFMRKITEGVFDQYVGEYRFAERPELVVQIKSEDGLLVGYGGGQRSVLASIDEGTLVATAFDGEGRFERDHSGRIVQFVYYECGARLGVAEKLNAARGIN